MHSSKQILLQSEKESTWWQRSRKTRILCVPSEVCKTCCIQKDVIFSELSGLTLKQKAKKVSLLGGVLSPEDSCLAGGGRGLGSETAKAKK